MILVLVNCVQDETSRLDCPSRADSESEWRCGVMVPFHSFV